MEVWQIVWYLIVFAVCIFFAVLLIMLRVRVREEVRTEAQIDAQTGAQNVAPAPGVYSILSAEYRAIKSANSGSYQNRRDLGVLSTIIQKLAAGEEVDTRVIIFLLSRMNGTAEVIQKIKGAGTVC